MSSITSLLPPSTGAVQASRLLSPTTQPVPLISSDLAKPICYAHTAGVLIYYYLRSSALVQQPLETLLSDIIPLVTFQALFCAVCLPSAGNWYSGIGETGRGGKILEGSATSGRSSKSSAVSGTGSMRKRLAGHGGTSKVAAAGKTIGDAAALSGGSAQSRILPTILSLVLTIMIPPVPLAVLALVMGAPLYPTALFPHTLALSVHVSLLAFMPIFYTHGVSSTAWRDVAAAWLPFDEAGMWAGTVGCMVGGWIGAIPMALDWDREWQKWPCTVLWGAVIGWAAGKLLTSAAKLGVGKRIDLSVGKTPEQITNNVSSEETLNPKDK